MAWLSGWTYRKSITISNAGNNEIEVNLTVGNFDFSKAQRFGQDIRFTASDGTTELPLWRKSHDQDNDLADYWFRETTDATTVFMYYGNASAPDVSDISTVFTMLGEDFSGDDPGDFSPSDWTVNQGTDTKVYVSIKPELKKTALGIDAYVYDIDSNGTIFAGHFSDGKIYKSTDGGENWSAVYTFLGGSAKIFSIFVDSNDYIYSSRTGSGILVQSKDGGDNWSTTLSLTCATDGVVWKMAEDSAGKLYAAEYSTGDATEKCAYVYRSVDSGDNWTEIFSNDDNGRHAHFAYVDPNTDRLYISYEGGGVADEKLDYSDDAGDNWTNIQTQGGAPTSITAISGARFIAQDDISTPPVDIDKTTDDAALTTSYSPPATDDEVFFEWLRTDANDNVFGGAWTQANNERATIMGTWDAGATWHILETMATGVGNRGFTGGSRFATDGNVYFYDSTNADGYKSKLIDSRRNVLGISEDAETADLSKAVSLSGSFVIEHTSKVGQVDAVIAVLKLQDSGTERINVVYWLDELIKYHNGTDWISTGITYTADTEYDFKYEVDLVAKTWDLWVDGVEKATNIPFRVDGSAADTVSLEAGAVQQGTVNWADVRIRQFAATEPSASLGSEEEEAPIVANIAKTSLHYRRGGGK